MTKTFPRLIAELLDGIRYSAALRYHSLRTVLREGPEVVRLRRALRRFKLTVGNVTYPKVPVLLLPGCGMGDDIFADFARLIEMSGGVPLRLGIRKNYFCPGLLADRLIPEITRLSRQHGPLIAVAQSVAGPVLRYVAKRSPNLFQHLVFVGSPLQEPLRVGEASRRGYFALDRVRKREGQLAEGCSRLECDCPPWQIALRTELPDVPSTVVYSRRDQVVLFPSSIPAQEHLRGRVELLEVNTGHGGCLYHPLTCQRMVGLIEEYRKVLNNPEPVG